VDLYHLEDQELLVGLSGLLDLEYLENPLGQLVLGFLMDLVNLVGLVDLVDLIILVDLAGLLVREYLVDQEHLEGLVDLVNQLGLRGLVDRLALVDLVALAHQSK
jgi:hypothetical protein